MYRKKKKQMSLLPCGIWGTYERRSDMELDHERSCRLLQEGEGCGGIARALLYGKFNQKKCYDLI